MNFRIKAESMSESLNSYNKNQRILKFFNPKCKKFGSQTFISLLFYIKLYDYILDSPKKKKYYCQENENKHCIPRVLVVLKVVVITNKLVESLRCHHNHQEIPYSNYRQ